MSQSVLTIQEEATSDNAKWQAVSLAVLSGRTPSVSHTYTQRYTYLPAHTHIFSPPNSTTLSFGATRGLIECLEDTWGLVAAVTPEPLQVHQCHVLNCD